jgi:hypothetical protein
MEGKDRWEQKGRIFLSLFISFTLLSTTSLLPFRLHSLPTIYHPTLHSGSPTTRDPVFTLNEQYSTGQSDPNGRHQWNGTVWIGQRQRNSSVRKMDNGKHPSHGQGLSWMAKTTAFDCARTWNCVRDEPVCLPTECRVPDGLRVAAEGT